MKQIGGMQGRAMTIQEPKVKLKPDGAKMLD
jgi:hypothetical protein